jgi:hypothetical protein
LKSVYIAPGGSTDVLVADFFGVGAGAEVVVVVVVVVVVFVVVAFVVVAAGVVVASVEVATGIEEGKATMPPSGAVDVGCSTAFSVGRGSGVTTTS